ncbi:hypothetical protein D3C73_1079320 [compost metagenome]
MHTLEFIAQQRQLSAKTGAACCFAILPGFFAHHRQQLSEGPAFIAQHFAQQQVIGLDFVTALVNHRDSAVAQGLFNGELGDVAVPTEDLQGIAGQAKTLLSEKSLDHRRQKLRQLQGTLPSGQVRGMLGLIEQMRSPVTNGAHALGAGL